MVGFDFLVVLQLLPGVVKDLDEANVDRDCDEAIDGRVCSPHRQGSLLAKVGCFNTGGIIWIKTDLTNSTDTRVPHNNSGDELCQIAKSPD